MNSSEVKYLKDDVNSWEVTICAFDADTQLVYIPVDGNIISKHSKALLKSNVI